MSSPYNHVTCPISYHINISTAQSPCHVNIHTTQSPYHVSIRTTTCHLYCHVASCHWATSCTDCHVSHPYTATCQFHTGPTHLENAKTEWHISPSGAATCPVDITSRIANVNSTTCWLWQVWLFAYLKNQSERDNFHIQHPFVKKNIWPESTQRARHNGVGFVRFQELWFLGLPGSILDHLPTIDSRSICNSLNA